MNAFKWLRMYEKQNKVLKQTYELEKKADELIRKARITTHSSIATLQEMDEANLIAAWAVEDLANSVNQYIAYNVLLQGE